MDRRALSQLLVVVSSVLLLGFLIHPISQVMARARWYAVDLYPDHTPVCIPTPITIGQTVSGALATSDCRSPVRGNSFYADRYSFSVSAGQQVAILLTSADFDTYLYLIGPSGSIVTQDDDGGDGLNSRIPPESGYFTLPDNGTYIIEATSYSSDAIGNYFLSLLSNAPTPGPTLTPTPGPTLAPTPTLPPGGTRYGAQCDTYISQWYPTSNYDASPLLGVRQGDIVASLLKFDLRTLPPTTTIHAARLNLYVYHRSNQGGLYAKVYKVRRDWVSSQATWNRASNAVAWASPGCNGLGTDRDEVPECTVHLDAENRWFSFDVTELVREWVADPSSNHGLVIKGEGGVSVQYEFASSEWEDAAFRPQLVVSSGELPLTATPTETGTPGPTPSRTPTPGRARVYLSVLLSSLPRSSPTPTATPWCDPYEPNDDRWHPSGPLVSGQSYQAKLCRRDPQDNYYLDATTAGSLQIRLQQPRALVDHTGLWVYSADDLARPLPNCGTGPIRVGDYLCTCSLPRAGRYVVNFYSANPDVYYDDLNPYTLQATYQ